MHACPWSSLTNSTSIYTICIVIYRWMLANILCGVSSYLQSPERRYTVNKRCGKRLSFVPLPRTICGLHFIVPVYSVLPMDQKLECWQGLLIKQRGPAPACVHACIFISWTNSACLHYWLISELELDREPFMAYVLADLAASKG